MSIDKSIHVVTDGAHARLREMDAAIHAMEMRLNAALGEARLQAHLALMDARDWRDTFKAGLDAAEDQIENRLQRAWDGFEQAVQRWIRATNDHAHVLQAQARIHMANWDGLARAFQEDVSNLQEQVVALVQRERVAAAEAATRHRQKLKDLEAAGAHSLKAMSDALSASRQAFDAAGLAVRTEVARALGKEPVGP
jgi:hypothetical protein